MNLSRKITPTTPLVDAIAVIFILVLMVLVIYPTTGCSCGGKNSPLIKTKAYIKLLDFAMNAYFDDFGQYPVQANEAETPIELTATHPIFEILNGKNPRNKHYYTSIPKDIEQGKQQYYLILDANKDGVIEFAGKKIYAKVYIYVNYNQKTMIDNL
jgi:hypothetical protein